MCRGNVELAERGHQRQRDIRQRGLGRAWCDDGEDITGRERHGCRSAETGDARTCRKAHGADAGAVLADVGVRLCGGSDACDGLAPREIDRQREVARGDVVQDDLVSGRRALDAARDLGCSGCWHPGRAIEHERVTGSGWRRGDVDIRQIARLGGRLLNDTDGKLAPGTALRAEDHDDGGALRRGGHARRRRDRH